ncbi:MULTISPECIES: polysaccharide deacetylase family protein [Bacillaceae]|uniref:Polysaccharide deacetylase family protein n=1 Tax=Evansella alkalicola TaxID=745819 RepID=A0ABS6JPL2_9BACI|nr:MULTISPECIES: polysaccharide deacetylase family protein [Bacillaceae]MBU9720503.1 polysaccharide deacetylase family protein [Bacillus alkalicola]
MKKWGLLVIILSLILFAACNGGDDDSDEVDLDDTDNGSEEQEPELHEDSDERQEDGSIEEESDTEERDEGSHEDEGLEEEEEVAEVTEPLYQMDGSTVRPIDEETSPNVVLLTIDDSFNDANHNNALEMAQILMDLDAKAIFFINGRYIQDENEHAENRAILKEIYEMGFEIGNHTMNHAGSYPGLASLTPEEQRKEIVELNDLIEEIIGERPRFFRAPYGRNTDESREILEEEEMQWMNWSYGFDWESPYMEADALTEIMLDPGKDGANVSLTNGANLLMHDREWTKDALHDIVVGLREQGFEIVDPALIK